MRKKLLLIISTSLLIVISIFLVKSAIYLWNHDDEQNIIRENVAIYIDESVGDGYQLSTSKTFPGAEYILDYYKSECTNGSAVSQSADRSVNLTYDMASQCTLYFYRYVKEPLSSKILKNANAASISSYANGKTGEAYTFTHNATALTGALTDYRYIGSSPNNYVKFNDDIWRIIGLFNDNGDMKVKLMSPKSIGNAAWNTADQNDWETASMRTLLNSGAYYNRTGTYASTGLTALSKTQIADTTWYLGGIDSYQGKVLEDYYNFERGTMTCASMGICEGPRNTTITAQVGLFYPSDYIYTFAKGIDNTCTNTPRQCATNGNPSRSWMNGVFLSTDYSRSVTPFSDEQNPEDCVFAVCEGGNIAPTYPLTVTNNGAALPVVYLRGDLWVIDGDGRKDTPYVLDTPFYSVVNDNYYFAYDASNQWFASNNQNQNSTTAMTVVHIANTIPEGIRVDWTVNSEARYDKFTFLHNAVVLENEISGAGMSGSQYFNGIMAGDTLTFQYAKDGSQSQNGDTATFKIVRNPTVQNDATYYFVYDSATGMYTSNNQDKDKTTARTKLTVHENTTLEIDYYVDSEPRYDKFRIYKNGAVALEDVSGTESGKVLVPVIPGDVLTFEYEKDINTKEGTDTASFEVGIFRG